MRGLFDITDPRYWYYFKRDFKEWMMDRDPESIVIGIIFGIIIVGAFWLWFYACKGLFFKD